MPPSGQPFSLLGLHNTTAISHTFTQLRSRFQRLFKRKAHLHHYTSIDGFELYNFTEAEASLLDRIEQYKSLQRNIPVNIPRMKIA